MKPKLMTRAQIEGRVALRIREIESDARFQAKPALVQINAPLALIQCNFAGEIAALRWVLTMIGGNHAARP